MVGEVAADQCEIESGRRCHPVEIEAAGVEGICCVLSRGRHLLAISVLTGGEPEFSGRPVEVVLKPVVGIGTTAELGVVVRRNKPRMPQRRLVRGAGRFQQDSGVRGISGTDQPCTLSGNRGQLQARRRRGPVQHSFGRVLVRPAWHR